MKSNLFTKFDNQAVLSETIQAYANIIAHDQRSPLTCINMATRCCNELLQRLDSGRFINTEQINEFKRWITIIDEAATKMSAISDNALKNINSMVDANNGLSNNLNLNECNITDSLNPEALKLLFIIYDPKLVHIDLKHQFKYIGNKQSMDQVIQNILQNAFYQIKKHGKGEIFISTESRDKTNILRIKDTASGVSPAVIKNMFNAGFTTKADGSGVGLDFCKRTMQLFGGDINASLINDDCIEFRLDFPKISVI